MAMALPKQDGKKKICNWFVAMPLPKQGGIFFFFFGNCGNPIAKNGKEKKKLFPKSGKELKKSATSTIFLQHFHNKLQVISYYQFKFEFNTEITFLSNNNNQ